MKKKIVMIMITGMITDAKNNVILISKNDLQDIDDCDNHDHHLSSVSGHFPTNDHPEPLHLALQQQEDHVHGQVSGF